MSVTDTLHRYCRAPAWMAGVGLLALGGCTLFSGCTLFNSPEIETPFTAARNILPPLKPPADAVQLQVIFLERPADDPLVQKLVWQELDQVGAMSPEARTILDQNGLKVGQSGSHPPPTLQKLLGMTEQLVDAADEDRQLMRGRRIGLRSSQESEIQTLDQPFDATIRYRLDRQEETVSYEQLRPVLKVRPVRVQDGWIRMEFAPEMHHGAARLRHTATDDGWAFRGGQVCDARYALKFHVMLNNGEMVVISGNLDMPDSAGAQFFRREVDGRPTQRLLVVRLTDSGRSATDPLTQ